MTAAMLILITTPLVTLGFSWTAGGAGAAAACRLLPSCSSRTAAQRMPAVSAREGRATIAPDLSIVNPKNSHDLLRFERMLSVKPYPVNCPFDGEELFNAAAPLTLQAEPNRVVGASVSVVEKLDEATGASVQITKLNDTLSSTTCLQAGTAIVEKFDEATGASAQINKLNDTLSSAIRGTPPGSPKLADTVAGASAPTDAVHAAEPPLSAEEMRDLIEQDVAMACSESAPRPAAPFEFARGNKPLEVSAPTDVRHLGPDECIALLTQQQAEAEATKGRAAIPETGLFEPAVLVPQDPSEEPTEVPTEAPEPMTESLIADIARVHASEMVQLKEMGFTDEDRIRAVLEAANGDVIAAVEMLSDK